MDIKKSRILFDNNQLTRSLMARMRDRLTGQEQYRKLVKQITMSMAPHVLQDMPLKRTHIDAQCGSYDDDLIDQEHLAFIPILRAGKPVSDALHDLLPDASLGYVVACGAKEGKHRIEHANIPNDIHNRVGLLTEQIIVTGRSIINSIQVLKESGCPDVRAMALFATKSGLEDIHKYHPDVPISVGALDDVVKIINYDTNDIIFPYTGDTGERAYGKTPVGDIIRNI